MNKLSIIGTMLVSRNADILDITIPELVKLCDWVMILMDNESDEVEKKIYYYQKIYYKILWK